VVLKEGSVMVAQSLAPVHPTAQAGGLPVTDVGRDLAIPAIGMAPWGTHFCEFFSTQQDLLETLVPYIRAGLEGNEACIWRACAPLDAEQAAEAMSREIDDFERRVADGQLMIMSTAGWYTTQERFEKDQVLSTVVPRVTTFLERGFSGMRVTGNMAWLEDRDWDEFMSYEEGLNQVMSGRNIIGLCTYSLDKCNADHLLDVLMRHQFALVKHEEWTLIEPSERKRATEAVERMNVALAERTTQLQAALADLRGFSRWVTRDLGAPLASITSLGDLLAEAGAGKLDDDELVMLERIRGSAARMDQLIRSILEYSTAQQAPLQARPLDLRALVAEVWPGVLSAVGGRPPGLWIGNLPMAHGDRVLVSQALGALLANAVRATAAQPDGLVQVGEMVTRDGGSAYYVRDNGIGFDPAEAESLFGAFTRLRSVAESEGTGLGLAVAKAVVTRHGGRIWAESEPGAGATFYFTLPDPDRPAHPA
jgi:signal transduction histidine kinase